MTEQRCNATLTTATVEPCNQCNVPQDYHHHTLTCVDHPDGDPAVDPDARHENEYVQWYDNTPGAVPHVDKEQTDD